MSSFSKNVCVCASVQHGLKADSFLWGKQGVRKTREYEMLSNNGISAYSSFYVPSCKSKVNLLILDQK